MVYKDLITSWSQRKEEALEQFDWRYAFCWGRAEHAHHAIIGRMRGHPELDDVLNLLPLCSQCHRYADGWLATQRAWVILCSVHGQDRMEEWLDGVDLINKPTVESLNA